MERQGTKLRKRIKYSSVISYSTIFRSLAATFKSYNTIYFLKVKREPLFATFVFRINVRRNAAGYWKAVEVLDKRVVYIKDVKLFKIHGSI